MTRNGASFTGLALMQARHAETVEKHHVSLRLRPACEANDPRCSRRPRCLEINGAADFHTLHHFTFWPAPAIVCTSPLPCRNLYHYPVDVAPWLSHVYPSSTFCHCSNVYFYALDSAELSHRLDQGIVRKARSQAQL